MKDSKAMLRYLGYRMLADGGRGFDFSIQPVDAAVTLTTVEMPIPLFTEIDRLTIQEGPGICYETLLCRIENDSSKVPPCLTLTPAEVVQHRRTIKKLPRLRR